MKSSLRTIIFLPILLITVFMLQGLTYEDKEKTSCVVNFGFADNSGGQFKLYSGWDCGDSTGAYLGTYTIPAFGVKDIDFSQWSGGCGSGVTFSIVAVCVGVPASCSYFVPINIKNTIYVPKCP